MSSFFEALKTVAYVTIGLVLVLAIMGSCWGSYLLDPQEHINKVETGVNCTLYSDTTAKCGAYSDDYYTIVVNDSAGAMWSSPCIYCGSQYGGHHTESWWYYSEAAANSPL